MLSIGTKNRDLKEKNYMIMSMIGFFVIGILKMIPAGLIGFNWIGLLSGRKDNEYFWLVQVVRVFATAIIIFAYIELMLIDLTFASLFNNFAWLIAIIVIVDSIISTVEAESTGISLLGGFIGLILALVWIYMVFIQPMTIKQELYAQVEITEKKDMQEIKDLESMILVSGSLADQKGDAVASKVTNANYFNEGSYKVSKYNGELLHSAPLEFDSFMKVRKAHETPGFTIVPALDPSGSAKLVEQDMVYLDSNYFDKDLYRHVRKEYPDKIIFGQYFQPVNEKESYFVFQVGSYMNYRTGHKQEGIITVHPKTGEMDYYDLDEVPEWVSRVYSVDTAMNLWSIWGKNKNGWWNQSTFGSKTDVVVPNADTLQISINNDGDIIYVTDFVKQRDLGSTTNIIGYGEFNARTGKMTYYTNNDAILTGQEAINKINASEALKLKGSVTFANYYRIYGAPTYVSPVMDTSNKFVGVAVMYGDSNNPIVVFGKNKEDAFRNYKREIASVGKGNSNTPSATVELEKVSGIITKVNDANYPQGYVFLLKLEGNEKIFSVNPEIYPEVVLLEKGEKVNLEVLDMEEKIIPAEVFSIIE